MTLLSKDNVRNQVTKEEVEGAKKYFIHKNVFKTENEKLKEIDSAHVGELI
ncbi:hypothetical protein CCE28_02985 [Anaeromicrobium sediminis]|uniref:Uncharacterized protein n=1 Tax=Anaeromicrobium sediminis TaxID=1478221 RepID=A0A267MM86_9FIRM|nr:hypothetical protein CCE28_02985 [Anaeromicrobium sediminis]